MADIARTISTPADRPLSVRIGTVIYVAFVFAAMRFCCSMIPERHGIVIVYFFGCLMGFALTVGYPLLIMKLWQDSPGTFFRWLFWNVVLLVPAIYAGFLSLTNH
jgi:hypothetical protein